MTVHYKCMKDGLFGEFKKKGRQENLKKSIYTKFQGVFL